MAKVVGKFASGTPSLPESFDKWMIQQDGFNERLGLIPKSVAPSTVSSIITEAANGKLGRLYELYDKMVSTDARIGGIVGSLSSTVVGLPMKIMKAKGIGVRENEIAEDYRGLVIEALQNPEFDVHAFIKQLVEVFFYGTRVFQVRWFDVDFPRGKNFHLPRQPQLVPGQKLEQEMQSQHEKWGELKIIQTNNPEGIFVSDQDQRSLFEVASGNHIGRHDIAGVLRRCLGWWITKVYAQLWWAEWVEMYGQPMRVGRYPAEATKSQKRELRTFLKTVGRNKWGIFPQGMDVQLKESTTQGNVTTFRDLIQMASNEIAVAIIGQTGITTDSSQGSRAKLETLFEIRQEIVKEVGRLVTAGMSHLIKAILWVNYGENYNRRLAPKAHMALPRPGEQKDLVEMFSKLIGTGYPVSLTEISESLAIPEPEAGELILRSGKIQEMPEDPTELETQSEENGGSISNNAEESVPEGEETPSDGSNGAGDGEDNSGENS